MSGNLEGDEEEGRRVEEPLKDFDDSANDLWSLFGKQAKSYDEAWAKALKEDMDGVLIFAGLLSGVLTAFLLSKIQSLKANPADQSVYFQNQTVQILDRISRQLASADGQISVNYTPPLPYPTFHPSVSDHRVNILWFISLVCSLSAAFLATLVQQWARGYMRLFTSPRKPLKTARIRMFLFERVERLPKVAEFVPGLIHFSLILFFTGIIDILRHIDKTIFITTLVFIVVGASFYLYWVIAPMWNPQLPYRTPFSVYISNVIRKLLRLASMEDSAMKESEGRTKRDVRALQWLIDDINEIDVQTFVLAFIDSFNEKWGRNVWRAVVSDDPVDQPRPGRPSPREGATVYHLCRYVRLFLEKARHSTDTDVRRGHTREWIEAMASLVCLTDVKLGSFGQVGEVLSEVGEKEQTNDPSAGLNPLFTVRWTCLSLVAIKQIVNDSRRLQNMAKFALDGIILFQPNSGSRGNVETALTAAQKMDGYLEKAWAAVLDLRQALEPWDQNQTGTESDIRSILNGHEASIHELEGIAREAADLEDIDWRIRLLQETMDEVTHKLMRHLPGVFFDKLQPSVPSMTSEASELPSVETTPILPQLVRPGQQLQSLCILGRRLRDIAEGQNTELQEDTIKSLAYLREVPVSLPELKHLMERQLGRLLDLREGRGLGFTIELFLHALRQLLPTSPSPDTSSSSELTKEFYTRTFDVITSNSGTINNLDGTQRVLLDILCDLVIKRRGIFSFSDFTYPQYIVDMLLALLRKMVKGHRCSHPRLIDNVLNELRNEDHRNCTDHGIRLQEEVLNAFSNPVPS